MGRKLITRDTVEELLRAGTSRLVVEPGTIVTDAAADRARDGGLVLLEGGDARPTAEDVRAAVVARLGYAPDGLDAVVARVLAE